MERAFGAETLGRLRRRAEQASAAGQDTFAVPEAAPVLERVALLSPPGPLRTEAQAWPGAGAGYHRLVRLAARAVAAFSGPGPPGEAVYGPKASGELEPMLRLWPWVLAMPTTIALTPL
ncbi:MAG: hypothetical protein ACJ8AT_33280, partial [Hyalangium sp.]|uniref:hypothetical protein n=1 Tax=Hyalangium sp. TaxID=2028555 RepID=UPI00389AB6BD